MKSTGVRGVETNEFSRFVDHTLATPWEGLVSDIEKALRSFNNQKKAIAAYEQNLLLLKAKAASISQFQGEEIDSASKSNNETSLSSTDSLPALVVSPPSLELPAVKRIITIRYQDTEFHLEEFHADNSSTSTISNGTIYSPDVIDGKCSVMENNWICNQLKIREFLLLYPTLVRGSEWKEELRTTILSAFTIAVKSVGDQLQYSVFYTHSLINLSSPENVIRRLDLELMDDLVGYNRVEHNSNQSTGGISGTKCWIRFDSSTYRGMAAFATSGTGSSSTGSNGNGSNTNAGSNNAAQVAMLQSHRRHPLFFYDGVRKLYQKKVRILSLDQLMDDVSRNGAAFESIIEHFTSSVKHIYEYPSEVWTTVVIPHAFLSAAKPGSPSSKSLQPSTLVSATAVSKDLLYLSDFVNYQFTQLLSSSFHGSSQYHKFILEKLEVSIEFHELNQLSIIDNDTYSTFLPAKQQPCCWKLTAKFSPSPYIPLYNLILPIQGNVSQPGPSLPTSPTGSNFNHGQGSTPVSPILNPQEEELSALAYTIWKSSVLQKLVSFFVLVFFASQRRCQQTKHELTLENSFVIERLFDERTFEEMKTLLEQLSETLQQTFYGTMFSDELLEKLVAGIPVFASNNPNGSALNGSSGSFKPFTGASVGFPRSKSLNSNASADESLRNSFASGGNALKSGSEEHEEETIQQVLSCLFCKSSSVGQKMFSETLNNDDKIKESNYAENWFQIFAIFSGLSTAVKGSTIIKLWQSCMREFQYMFDHNIPISWKCFAPRLDQHVNGADVESSKTLSSVVPPVYAQLLWDDVLLRHSNNNDNHLTYPDLSKSIVIQKLQMIQFCSAMQNETLIYEFPTSGRDQGIFFPKLFRRVPLTEDIVALQNHIVKKFQTQSSDQPGQKPVTNDNPMLQYQVQLPSLLSDMNCFRAANRDADLMTFCKWYGILDQDFLQCQNNLSKCSNIRSQQSLAMMLRFTPASEGNDLNEDETTEMQRKHNAIIENLKEIWDEHSTPMTCDQQKALFSAEKELGKAIAYLDRLPAVDFAFDLVYQAMIWIKNSFDFLISRYVSGIDNVDKDLEDVSVLDKKMLKFEELLNMLEEYRQSKRQSSSGIQSSIFNSSLSPMKVDSSLPLSPTSPLSSTIPSKTVVTPLTPLHSILSTTLSSQGEKWNLFHLLDQITLIVEDIEITLCKIIQVSLVAGTIHSSAEERRSMLSQWIHDNTSNLQETYTLQSDDEVRVLRSMIKSIHNRNGRGHDWHSYDGRELGLPHVKEFELKSFSNKLYQSCGHHSNPSLTNLHSAVTVTHGSRTVSRSSADQPVSPLGNDHNLSYTDSEEMNVVGLPVEEEVATSASVRLDFIGEEATATELQDVDFSSSQKDFEMLAITDGGKIRVIYSHVERD